MPTLDGADCRADQLGKKGAADSSDFHLAVNLNKGPFGGRHLHGDSCPPITFEVVPY